MHKMLFHTHHDQIEHFIGKLCIAILFLEWKRVLVKPIQQWLVVAQAQIGKLYSMNVTIDEAGHDKLTRLQVFNLVPIFIFDGLFSQIHRSDLKK